MKTNLESITNLEKKLKIEVPPQQVNEEFDKAFKYLQREVNLKGFRKGKAPLQQIRTMYGDRVKEDVRNNIVQSSFVSAIKEHKLNPISQPTLDFGDLQENSPFNFTINFEVRPEVKIVKKTGLKVQKEKVTVTEKEIEDSVQKIRMNQAAFTSITEDRPLKNGDTAMIDFVGYIDGAPLENGAATGHMLEIGSNQFIPGFEEGLVGMKKG
ncbi:MAG: trigger factor, partial [Bdellovibrionales bacterium]|nr:trigger factor [Bdellovibrionales bacterium]